MQIADCIGHSTVSTDAKSFADADFRFFDKQENVEIAQQPCHFTKIKEFQVYNMQKTGHFVRNVLFEYDKYHT